MPFLNLFYVFLAGSVATVAAAEPSPPGKMNPVALLWPPSRDGSDGLSTTAPCGSWEGTIVRHDFPLGTYAVPLTASNESWVAKLSISYIDDPKSNDDFERIFSGSFANVEKQCIAVAVPSDIRPGMPATFQLQFHDENDKDKKPHYVCSDVAFVSRKAMESETPCSGPLSDEVEAAILPPPPSLSKSYMPSHGSTGSFLALVALVMFSYISYAFVLPRIRQRQKESGNAVEMARMIS